MEVFDEWARGVVNLQVSEFCLLDDAFGDAVGSEQERCLVGDLLDIIDEDRSILRHCSRDVIVMHQFVEYVDWLDLLLDEAIEEFDGSFDSGTESVVLGDMELLLSVGTICVHWIVLVIRQVCGGAFFRR